MITIGDNTHQTHEQLKAQILAGPLPELPTFPEDMSLVTERVRKIVGKISASRGFARAHPIIARLLDEEEKRRERKGTDGYRVLRDELLFESPLEQRRLQILNALFLTLQRCGHTPWIRDRQVRELGVRIGQQNVSFTLDRVTSRPIMPTRPLDATKTPRHEKLRLSIAPWDSQSGTAKSWQDTDTAKIEDHLADIVIELIVAGEAHYRAASKHRHQWHVQFKAELEAEARRKAEEDRRRERERLAKLAKERLDRLFNQAADWRRAGDLRAFVAEVRRTAHTPDRASAAKLEQWASWALSEADRIDPLLDGRLQAPETDNNGS